MRRSKHGLALVMDCKGRNFFAYWYSYPRQMGVHFADIVTNNQPSPPRKLRRTFEIDLRQTLSEIQPTDSEEKKPTEGPDEDVSYLAIRKAQIRIQQLRQRKKKGQRDVNFQFAALRRHADY